MPFAAPLNQDPNDPNKKGQNGVNISGSSNTFATGVPGQDASTSGAKQQGSGQYTNIQSYLDANKQQGDQMGQKITTDVSNQAEDATSKINSLQAQAPHVNAYDPNAAIKNATTLSDVEKAQYKDEKKTGGYTGPSTVDQVNGYQDAQKATSTASQNVANAGNEQGQQTLLRQAYLRPQYSAGENRLDQTLLQNSAGSKANLENLSKKYSGINQMFNTASTNLGNAVNAANTQALANKQAFIPAEQNAVKGLIDPIQARADQANANNGAYIDRVTKDAGDETLSDETMNALGLTAGQKLFGLNLADYITPDRSQVGINNAATADERSKYAALSSLFDNPTMNQITTDGKAINPVSFDKSRFNSNLGLKQSEYDDAYNNQRGTILNSQYLLDNLNSTGGYNEWIPGALTPRRDLTDATAADLEKFWLPLFAQAHNNSVLAGQAPGGRSLYSRTADAINQSLADWKNKYNTDRVIKKG